LAGQPFSVFSLKMLSFNNLEYLIFINNFTNKEGVCVKKNDVFCKICGQNIGAEEVVVG
jgi:hypothetical protein